MLTSSVFTKCCSQRDHYLQSKEDGAEDPAEDPDTFWDDFFQPALIRLNENFMQKRDQFCAFSQKMYSKCRWFASEMDSGSEKEQNY